MRHKRTPKLVTMKAISPMALVGRSVGILLLYEWGYCLNDCGRHNLLLGIANEESFLLCDSRKSIKLLCDELRSGCCGSPIKFLLCRGEVLRCFEERYHLLCHGRVLLVDLFQIGKFGYWGRQGLNLLHRNRRL